MGPMRKFGFHTSYYNTRNHVVRYKNQIFLLLFKIPAAADAFSKNNAPSFCSPRAQNRLAASSPAPPVLRAGRPRARPQAAQVRRMVCVQTPAAREAIAKRRRRRTRSAQRNPGAASLYKVGDSEGRGRAAAPPQRVENVAERHIFELSQVLPLAFAPGRQNLQRTKPYRFSSVLTRMPPEREKRMRLRPGSTKEDFFDRV